MRLERREIEFEWDKGNAGKNRKHGVEDSEAEEPFFDERKLLLRDLAHSTIEERFILLGKTKKERLLFVAFTRRGGMIRIISARDMRRDERPLYEEAA